MALTRAGLLVSVVSVALAGPALAGSEDGWAAYEAERFTEAVRLWAPAAEAGEASAQFGLGIAYDFGQGVAADPSAACAWYRRAGAAGHAVAAFNTAVMQDSSRCGPRRAEVAALWYARAAAAGHARAQFNMGQLYSTGDGVPRNPDLAAAWFRLAGANGITAATGRERPMPRTAPNRTPLPAAPADADAAQPKAGGAAVLVWTAPAQPARVRFLVELAALHPDGPQEVLAQWLDESAIQVRLPPGSTNFAWRVLTVAAEAGRYAAMPWQPLDARP